MDAKTLGLLTLAVVPVLGYAGAYGGGSGTPLVQGTTDNTIPRFDGTTGLLQTSGVSINDSDQLTTTTLKVGGGTSIVKIRQVASSSIDLGGSTTATCTAETNVAIAAVSAGDLCNAQPAGALAATDWIECRSLTGNVALKYCTQGVAIDPAAQVYTITVIQF